jgi:sugar lactone lactonase YvrE
MRTFAIVAIAFLTGCTGSIVPKDAWVQKVSTGYKFTEGPAYDGHGSLYFSDIPNQRIIKFDVASKRESVFRENSGGANGLFFDADGRLLACEGGARRVTRTEKDGKITVLANYTPFGNRLNSPNDLVADNSGGVYFTDPKYGKDRSSMEYKYEGVFYISASGKVIMVIKDLIRPNGIIMSNTKRTLYVADEAAKVIVAYDVGEPGQLSNKRVFASLDPNGQGGVDGMAIDKGGNIYGCAQGKIWIWNPKGALVSTINVAEKPANCTFVNDELYITARTSLYKVKLNTTGGAGGR